MLIVAGTAVFGTEAEVDRLLEAGLAMIAASRKEDGCLDYTYARDATDPCVMRFFELWKDQAALDYHFATPHMATFRKALGEMAPKKIDAKIYDVSGTRPLGG